MGDTLKALVVLLSSVCLFVSSVASAQVAPETATFPIERLRPSVDRDGIISVEWAGLPDAWSWDIALWLNYANDPLVLETVDTDGNREELGPLVAHRFTANLVGGFVPFRQIYIGLDLPIIFVNSRGDSDAADVLQAGDLASIGIGDLRLIPKFQLLRSADHWLDLAVLPIVTFPTATPADAYMGEDGFAFAPELAASKIFGPIRTAINLGVQIRPSSEFRDLEVSSEMIYRLGLGYLIGGDIRTRKGEVQAEVSGTTNLTSPFSSRNQNTVEPRLGGVYEIRNVNMQVFGGVGVGLEAGFGSPDFRVFTGVRYSPRVYDRDGDGYLDAEDGCPDDPEDFDGFEDLDGCPEADNDQDGVGDLDDSCPGVDEDAGNAFYDVAEDIDSFEDGDGCPERDNDADTILDVADACPGTDADKENSFAFVAEDVDNFEDDDGCPELDNDSDSIVDTVDDCPGSDADVADNFIQAAESFNGYLDEDGCPDIFVVTCQQIEIDERVYFETDKDIIRERSFDLLNGVAMVLNANPDITLVRVEGHTDSSASDEYNLDLSQRRAASVVRYLVDAGVASERIVSEGYGESRPVDTNDTDEGMANNRRVEFIILEQIGCE